MVMRRVLAIFAFAILCAPCFAQGVTAPLCTDSHGKWISCHIVLAQPPYTPTKAQHAKLAKERAHIIAMQEKISDLQNQIAYEIEQATVTCKQIAAENGWPEGVTCNLQTLEFAAPAPKAEEKQPTPAPKEGKKQP